MNSKKIVIMSVSALAAVAIIVPASLLAQSASPTPRAGALGEKFCVQLDAYAAKLQARVDGKMTSARENRTKRDQQLAQGRQRRDDALKNLRAKEDANRSAHITKLESVAKTDARKAAVAEFKQTVLTAITTRQAAVNKATSDFRTALDAAIASRRDGVKSAISLFDASLDAALSQGKTDCAAGKNTASIRTTFRNSVKTAFDKLKSDRSSIEKLMTSADPIVAARKAAVQKALQDFKATMEAARTKLKAAFKTTSATVSPSPSASPSPTPAAS